MVFGGYKTTNNGISKVNIDGALVADPKEVAGLISAYKDLAVSSETAFYEYISTKDIAEYPLDEDKEDESRIIQLY